MQTLIMPDGSVLDNSTFGYIILNTTPPPPTKKSSEPKIAQKHCFGTKIVIITELIDSKYNSR